MPDPGQSVHSQLLNHVHLTSTMRYPFEPRQMSSDKTFATLFQASRIVKEQNPVAWQYLTRPQDGSMFLMWQPLSQLGNMFATDGYIWAEPESVYQHELNGYMIELRVYESGFIPNVEQVATHRRVRYRFVAGPSIDPALEIVHYMQARPDHHVSATSVQVTPAKQSLMQQRRYLESQGGLDRKEFMLYDINNWPRINMPTKQNAMLPPYPYQGRHGYNPAYAQPPRNHAPPQYAAAAAAATQQSQAWNQNGPKTARRVTSARAPGAIAPSVTAAADSYEEMALADEDAHNYGDTLDMLTPREISITRYREHDEWMAEILASPFATSQILPIDLNHTLTGELAEITDGIFESRDAASDSAPTQTQVDELKERVAKFTETMSKELTRMNQVHEQRLEEFRAQKQYDDLERQLSKAGSNENREVVDEIVRNIERSTGCRIRSREEIVQVQKGGLQLNGEESNPNPNLTANQGNDEFGDFANMDTAGEALDFYSGSYDHMAYAA